MQLSSEIRTVINTIDYVISCLVPVTFISWRLFHFSYEDCPKVSELSSFFRAGVNFSDMAEGILQNSPHLIKQRASTGVSLPETDLDSYFRGLQCTRGISFLIVSLSSNRCRRGLCQVSMEAGEVVAGDFVWKISAQGSMTAQVNKPVTSSPKTWSFPLNCIKQFSQNFNLSFYFDRLTSKSIFVGYNTFIFEKNNQNWVDIDFEVLFSAEARIEAVTETTVVMYWGH